MLDRRGEDFPRLIEIAAGKEHAVDLGAILRPLLDLVVIAVVRDHRLVRLLVRQFAHCTRAGRNFYQKRNVSFALFYSTPTSAFSATKHSEVRLPMSKLSNDERNLLRYYAETERTIHGSARGAVHRHLLQSGYIEERTVDSQGALVVVTAAGQKALGSRS